MPFTESAIFRQWLQDAVGPAAAPWNGSWSNAAQDWNVALFGDVTAAKDANGAATAYEGGVWTLAAEVSDDVTAPGGAWPPGGRPLVRDGSNKVPYTAAGDDITFNGEDTAGAGVLSLAGVFGDLLYNTAVLGPLAGKQGGAFHYFGGAQSVTGGTFTVVWNTAGIMVLSVV